MLAVTAFGHGRYSGKSWLLVMETSHELSEYLYMTPDSRVL